MNGINNTTGYLQPIYAPTVEQHLIDMRNLEEVNKKLKEGFIFLTTVQTTDTVLALLEKRSY